MISRTLAAAAALALTTLAAQAGTDAVDTAGGLTREAVIAEITAARQAPVTANTLRDGEWYNVAAPLSIGQTTAVAGQAGGTVAASKTTGTAQ